jgi:hypothetical protein
MDPLSLLELINVWIKGIVMNSIGWRFIAIGNNELFPHRVYYQIQ